MYSVIVFDLGNVLLPFDYSIMLNRFNELKPGLGDKFAKLYSENYEIHRSYESGKIPDEEFVSIMVERLENKVTGEEFCKIFSSVFSVNQNVIDLLSKLKKNYKLCLLSNTNEIHKKYGYEHYDFFKNFDKLFLSHEIGAIKPEEKIYRTVENYTQKPSSEHLFVDDVLEYVNGAKNCGWDAIQFVGYDNLLENFLSRGIIL
jgi:glucose-1-phosphatase